MKAYILSVVGAALLSALANMISPNQWRKYMKVITGLVVVSILLSPASDLFHIDIFSDFSFEESQLNENAQQQAIVEELQSRIAADIAARLKDEFYVVCSVRVSVSTDENMLIEGVGRVHITGFSGDKSAVRRRLSEVYGVPPSEVIFE